MQQLEAEISGHQTQIDEIGNKAQELIKSKHFAKERVAAKAQQLDAAWKELKELVAQKRAMLNLTRKVKYEFSNG